MDPILRQKIKHECELSFSRSSGKGGQNVNKVESKVQLKWNPLSSICVPQPVIFRFMERYGHMLNNDGELLLQSQESRDQKQNVERVYDKIESLLASVWRPPKKRIPTKPTRSSKEKRLGQKKRHSEKKKMRQSFD